MNSKVKEFKRKGSTIAIGMFTKRVPAFGITLLGLSDWLNFGRNVIRIVFYKICLIIEYDIAEKENN